MTMSDDAPLEGMNAWPAQFDDLFASSEGRFPRRNARNDRNLFRRVCTRGGPGTPAG